MTVISLSRCDAVRLLDADGNPVKDSSTLTSPEPVPTSRCYPSALGSYKG